MIQRRRRRLRHNPLRAAFILLTVAALALAAPLAAIADDSYVPISGAGSTWAQNAVDAWRVDVAQYGMRINYAGTGSSDGRRQFLNGTTDFAVSDIPFQFNPEDGSPPENPTAGSYAYMPIVAGGTVFMYNLTINGQRVTNLRLSGQNIAKIFTGVITSWNDPALTTDNPGLTLPNEPIVPVVRSDGSGSTAQFSLWMIAQQAQLWNAYCGKVGRGTACGETSYYPTTSGMIAKFGDLGVAGYISQDYAEGSIGYVNYSYALNAGFPVVKMLNAAGYYTEPTADNVAVSLVAAKINQNSNDPAVYLTQDLSDVYTDTDPRVYPLSSYSYFILPTTIQGQFNATKGKTLGAFSYYFMCQGQQEASSLGYSPLPINLVQAGFTQIAKIPGVDKQNITVAGCNNPTFSPDGHNSLVDQAPYPQACDKQGAVQCSTGSGGAKQSTPTQAQSTSSQALTTTSQPATSARGQTTSQQAQVSSGQPVAQTTQATGGGQATAQDNATDRQPTGATSDNGSRNVADRGSSGPTTVSQPRSGGRAVGGTKPPTGPAGGPKTVRRTTSGRVTTAAAAVQTAPSSCDADTGVCTAGSALPGDPAADGATSAVDGGVTVLAQSVPLSGVGGWSSSQTLMVVAGLCVLLLVLVPPIVARQINRKGPAR